METKYVQSPDMRVRRLRPGDAPVLWAGSGHDRMGVEVDAPDPAGLITWVLARTAPAGEVELQASLQTELGLDADAAKQVLTELIETAILVEPGTAALARSRAETWGALGWADAAAFHSATGAQKFDPDTLGGLDYPTYYRELLAETGAVGPQPSAAKPTDHYGPALAIAPSAPTTIATATVLEEVMPINRFEQSQISVADLVGLLGDAAGVQRTVGGVLGEHLIKAHPSGGARHPLECYVVAKTVEGLPAAVYHFDPVERLLRPVPDAGESEHVDQVCFGKGGIATAAAVAVITCRWLRHSWKYRYPRSYRMIMLELGHLIQTFNLAATARGLGAYHCPSLHDSAMSDLLALDDPGFESPLYAIGIGAEGIR